MPVGKPISVTFTHDMAIQSTSMEVFFAQEVTRQIKKMGREASSAREKMRRHTTGIKAAERRVLLSQMRRKK